jgi:hypothetical protein
MPDQTKRAATVWIDEYVRHAVAVEIKPEWLDSDGDLTDDGEEALHNTALERRGDDTIHDIKSVEVIEVEFIEE